MKVFLAIRVLPGAVTQLKDIQRLYNTGDFSWYERDGETVFPIIKSGKYAAEYIAYLVAEDKGK